MSHVDGDVVDVTTSCRYGDNVECSSVTPCNGFNIVNFDGGLTSGA